MSGYERKIVLQYSKVFEKNSLWNRICSICCCSRRAGLIRPLKDKNNTDEIPIFVPTSMFVCCREASIDAGCFGGTSECDSRFEIQPES